MPAVFPQAEQQRQQSQADFIGEWDDVRHEKVDDGQSGKQEKEGWKAEIQSGQDSADKRYAVH
jgi:hypothetical protein